VAGPAFRGRLINVDLGKRPEVGHLTIDKESIVHSMLLGYIQGTIKGPSPQTPAARSASSVSSRAAAPRKPREPVSPTTR
jgi:hypothetical protein